MAELWVTEGDEGAMLHHGVSDPKSFPLGLASNQQEQKHTFINQILTLLLSMTIGVPLSFSDPMFLNSEVRTSALWAELIMTRNASMGNMSSKLQYKRRVELCCDGDRCFHTVTSHDPLILIM